MVCSLLERTQIVAQAWRGRLFCIVYYVLKHMRSLKKEEKEKEC